MPLMPGHAGQLAQAASSQQAKPVVESLQRLKELDELERIQRGLIAAGEAAYRWVIETDQLFWGGNAAEVIGCNPETVATGRSFAALLDADNAVGRYDTVMNSASMDPGDGVPFQIEYLFRPKGRDGDESAWLEDCGRWFAGPNGRPAEVYGVVRRIDDRQKRDQQLNYLSNCDPLTGMMNRGRMTETLKEAIEAARNDDGNCAFLIAAINNLAVVNDAYGYEVADEVVVAVGHRLKQVVRTGDSIARYSGSKFGIILNNCGEDDLKTASERFLSVARESVIETGRGPVWALLSIGALNLPKHAEDVNTAMARAEEALMEARRLPSDGFIVYKPSEKLVSERSLNARCASEIVTCLKEDRFKLAFQAIFDAKTKSVVMHEALLRMADETGEMIAAVHLIPIAEKLGLVRLIDRAVVQLALASLLDYPDSRISFNISGTTATDPRWFSQIVDILSAHRNVMNRLTIEITETVALSDLEETARFTSALRDLGCSVAIDDFGAGYTSFRNLKPLNVDILKLDGSFCQDLTKNPDNEYFVRSLIDLAKKLELKTIAEWVQSPEDADCLRAWGIDYMQGNLFGEASLIPPWAPACRQAAVLTDVREFEAAPAKPGEGVLIPLSDLSGSSMDEEAQPFLLKGYIGQQPKQPIPPALNLPSLQPPRAEEDQSSTGSNTLAASFSRLKQALAALDKEFRSNNPAS
jgi:diguanylate cyclase (GGDEF)-like protein